MARTDDHASYWNNRFSVGFFAKNHMNDAGTPAPLQGMMKCALKARNGQWRMK